MLVMKEASTGNVKRMKTMLKLELLVSHERLNAS